MDRRVGFGLLVKWTGLLNQGPEQGAYVAQTFVVKPAAGMAPVDQMLAFIGADDHRAQSPPGPARLRKAADDHFLLVARLELEPTITSNALAIETVCLFRDYAFQTQLADGLVKGQAVLGNVLAQPHRR